jgi:hypothetical protein
VNEAQDLHATADDAVDDAVFPYDDLPQIRARQLWNDATGEGRKREVGCRAVNALEPPLRCRWVVPSDVRRFGQKIGPSLA